MVNVIDEGYSFGNEMGKSLGGLTGKTASAFVEQFAKNKQTEAEDKAYKRLTGKDLSGLPSQQKVAMAKALMAEDPYKEMQQYRLHLDSISKRYNQTLREINDSLKTYPTSSPEYKEALEMKNHLSKERNELLGFSKVVEEEIGDMEKDQKPVKKKKAAFDKSNPEHMKRRDTVLKKTKGDKAKAAAILAEEFD